MKIYKKFFVILMLILMVAVLTGCDTYSIPYSAYDQVIQSLITRVDQNKSIVSELYTSGLIDESTYISIVNAMDNNVNTIAAELDTTKSNVDASVQKQLSTLGKAITDWNMIIIDDSEADKFVTSWDSSTSNVKYYGFSFDTFSSQYLTNHLYYSIYCYYSHADNPADIELSYSVNSSTVNNVGTGKNFGYQINYSVNGTDRDAVIGYIKTVANNLRNYGTTANNKGKKAIIDNIPLFNNSGSAQITPITILDPKDNNWTEKLNYSICVLKDGVDLAGATEVVKKAQELKLQGKSGNEIWNVLNNHFEILTDDKNNKVKLIEGLTDTTQLVTYSKSPTLNASGAKIDGLTIKQAGNIMTWNADKDNKNYFKETNNPNVPGYDVVIHQEGRPVMAVKVYDFNSTTWKAIKSALKTGEGTYFTINTDQGGLAVLMQYDVGYIDGYSVDLSASSYTAEIKQSDLFINLLTGRIGKKVLLTSNAGYHYKSTSDIEEYISLNGGKISAASFAVYGKTGITGDGSSYPWDLEFGVDINDAIAGKNNGSVKRSIPRVVLRDYLELVYTPDVVGSEKLTAYGRMIRLGKPDPDNSNKWTFDGTLDEAGSIGGYVTINRNGDGNTYTGENIGLQDLADYSALIGTGSIDGDNVGKPFIAHLPSSPGGQLTDSATMQNTANVVKNNTEGEKLEDLQVVTIDSITTTCTFPGGNIAVSDWVDGEDYKVDPLQTTKVNNKPLFYGIAVCSSMSSSGLIKYIVDESDVDSTKWWNQWLKDHKFNYNIPTETTLGYLQDNYSFELGQAGIVTINLETVGKIQDEFDLLHKGNVTTTIRTIFKILGYVLVAYSLVVVVAWAIDVNVDFGLNLLNKATFGKMIAVSSSSEIPKTSGSKDTHEYVDASRIITVGLLIMAVGIIFCYLDIMVFVIKLVESVGNFSQYVSDILGR